MKRATFVRLPAALLRPRARAPGGLVDRSFTRVIDAHFIDLGHCTEERCKRRVVDRAIGVAA